jgi:hypothetical protein
MAHVIAEVGGTVGDGFVPELNVRAVIHPAHTVIQPLTL